jgi:hypothetical protein
MRPAKEHFQEKWHLVFRFGNATSKESISSKAGIHDPPSPNG